MIKDKDFIVSNSVPGPTKEEIRALVLSKANINSKDSVVDVGSGTGGISTEVALIAKNLISIDKNHNAVELTHNNLKKHTNSNITFIDYDLNGCPENLDINKENSNGNSSQNNANVTLFKGDAVSILNNISNGIDVVIIGGSNGDLSEILDSIISKPNNNNNNNNTINEDNNNNIRIIVTAILNETKVEAVSKLKELGFNVEIIEVSIAKGKIIERGTMMLAQNPIAIIYTV
ncbi:MAG: methyltransferase domain-containing protein [Methanobacteriaceae archaeon]